jgi:hypothetical protein
LTAISHRLSANKSIPSTKFETRIISNYKYQTGTGTGDSPLITQYSIILDTRLSVAMINANSNKEDRMTEYGFMVHTIEVAEADDAAGRGEQDDGGGVEPDCAESGQKPAYPEGRRLGDTSITWCGWASIWWSRY